jgi:hypothetical protein
MYEQYKTTVQGKGTDNLANTVLSCTCKYVPLGPFLTFPILPPSSFPSSPLSSSFLSPPSPFFSLSPLSLSFLLPFLTLPPSFSFPSPSLSIPFPFLSFPSPSFPYLPPIIFSKFPLFFPTALSIFCCLPFISVLPPSHSTLPLTKSLACFCGFNNLPPPPPPHPTPIMPIKPVCCSFFSQPDPGPTILWLSLSTIMSYCSN